MNGKIKVSIIGALGYTGMELLRILSAHQNVEILHIFSRNLAGTRIGDSILHLSHWGGNFTTASIEEIVQDSDCVFLALPHGESHEYVRKMLGFTKIIDLSADFRLKSQELHEKYYPDVGFSEDLSQKFTYGFVEKNIEGVKNAIAIANPGCFAILSQLCLLPLENFAKTVDIFAITGSSGSGKKISNTTHHPIRSHNLFSYNINKHRHIGEILQSFPKISLNMIPSSGPFVRGIFANCIVKTQEPAEKCLEKFNIQYEFIRRVEKVELANVIGANFCDISYTILDNNTILIQGAIDNLVKGAAGNAVQCMNLMFDFNQNAGLVNINPIYP